MIKYYYYYIYTIKLLGWRASDLYPCETSEDSGHSFVFENLNDL